MPKQVVIPQLGNEIDEAEIDEWLKAAGDTVAAGDQLLSITTPKLTLEIEAPVSGTIAEIRGQEGDLVKVGDVVAIIDET
jgi:pyruvate/2-oxoglutarate dehydrogenase complex dihydrolipoamide acyltransferase (E2) component